MGLTPRVLRYWEEQGIISPTREHGKLRYSPRDVAIARLIHQLLAAGTGVEEVRMLKKIAERDLRSSSAAGDPAALAEAALRILYQRKAFREETGMDEEHYPQGKPPPPRRPPHHGPVHLPNAPAALPASRATGQRPASNLSRHPLRGWPLACQAALGPIVDHLSADDPMLAAVGGWSRLNMSPSTGKVKRY